MGRRIAFSLALLFSTFAGLLSAQTGAAAQRSESGIEGNTYTDPGFRFVVEWDEDIFEAEAMLGDDDVPYGVFLFNDEVTASVAAGGYSDLDECLDDRVDRLESVDGVSRLRESSRVDPLEFDRDVVGAAYQYTYEDPDTGDSDTFATYFGCEPLLIDGEEQPDVVLTHDFGTALDVFEELSPTWVDLVNNIAFAGATDGRDDSNSGDETDGRDQTDRGDEPGVTGNRYLDPTNGWAVMWDDAVLTGENWMSEDGDSIVGLQVSSEGGGFMTMAVEEHRSERSCVTDQLDALEGDVLSDFEEVDDVDLPETGEDARAALYQGLFTTQAGDTSDIYLYVECRALIVDGEEVEDNFLVADLVLPIGVYEDELPAWSELLSSAEFDAATTSSNDDEDEDPDEDTTPRRTPTSDAAESGISGDTYTSGLGYQVSWDDSIYTAELLDESEPDLGVSISSNTSILNFQVAGDPTAGECVRAEADVVEGLSGMSSLSRSREDLPTGTPGGASDLYEGTLTFDDGSESAVFVYIECRPIGQVSDATLFLVIRMVGLADAYDNDLPQWQAILDSIRTIDPSGQ